MQLFLRQQKSLEKSVVPSIKVTWYRKSQILLITSAMRTKVGMPPAVALLHSLTQQSQISQGKGKKSQFSTMNGHKVTEEVCL